MDEERQRRLKEILQKMWEENRPETLERVQELESAVAALNGEFGEAERARSESIAHKLAGALGTYGLREASLAAREIEVCFAEAIYDAPRMRELLQKVRTAVET